MELVELRSKGLGAGFRALNGDGEIQSTQGGVARKKGPRKRGRGDGDAGEEEESEEEADDSAAVPATQTQSVRGKGEMAGSLKRHIVGTEFDNLSFPSFPGLPATSRSYILRSTLPSSLLSLMVIPKPLHTAPESDGLSGGGGGTQRIPDCGAILDVDRGDGHGGVGLMGLLWVILGIVLVHDRSIRDGECFVAFFLSMLRVSCLLFGS